MIALKIDVCQLCYRAHAYLQKEECPWVKETECPNCGDQHDDVTLQECIDIIFISADSVDGPMPASQRRSVVRNNRKRRRIVAVASAVRRKTQVETLLNSL